jgi:LPXTG-site transpeptidase (sortase) family protein
MNKSRFTIYSSYLALILLGFGLSLVFLIIKSQAVNYSGIIKPPIVTQNLSILSSAKISGTPTKLIIPSLGINLPITPGYYNQSTKTWTLTVDKVQYATISAEPNNLEGNTFLYGHARTAVFANLHSIQSNAKALVETSNNHIFYYVLASVQTVSPSNSSIFSYSGRPILTIQTCTGLFWQNRQFFTFDLVQVV